MTKTADFFIYDRLYGKIPIAKDALALFQTKELARLRQVSLSAVPTWALPTGLCASKFEHSIGVGRLAAIVGRSNDFSYYNRVLYAAALAHDIGTPPFSHISELFLESLFGKNHEQYVKEILDGSEFAGKLETMGISVPDVIKLIEGINPPISDIINGTVDIDNLDNSLRWGVSTAVLSHVTYSPEKLAGSFMLHKGKLCFSKKVIRELKAWENTRQEVYRFVYSIPNLAPAVMLLRALEYAARAGELTKNYFKLTDTQAFEYLLNKCNNQTKTIVEDIHRWRFYTLVYEAATGKPNKTIHRLDSNISALTDLTDSICYDLGIKPEKIAVYIRKGKEFKTINLPLIDEFGKLSRYVSEAKPVWRVHVLVHPEVAEKKKNLENTLVHYFI